MRMESTDISYRIAELMLEMEDVSEISELTTANFPKISESEYEYSMVSNPQDTSVSLTVSFQQTENSYNITITPYSEEMFSYQTEY